MEVVLHAPSAPGSPTMDPFDFNGGGRHRISPYLSAPSSPKRFGDYYLSAPASPSRLTDFYSDFDNYLSTTNPDADDDDGGFAFSVGGETEKPSRSAEELFDGGKIKLLKEDELYESARSPLLSPAHQAQPKKPSAIAQGKKAIRDAFSPRRNKDSSNDSFTPAAGGGDRRGRDRTPAAENSASGRRVSRSHSPYRISQYTWEEEQIQQRQSGNKEEAPTRGGLPATTASKSSSRKWRLRDFLLFRSASEGRGTSKDPFKKYPVSSFRKTTTEEGGKGSSFRNSENNPPKSRRKEPISAHELHYARKKAETEDLKKRTFLPYKQGILGRLAGFGL